MTWTVEWTAAEATPDWNQVLRSQGLPEGEALPARLVGLVDTAFEHYLALAEPRAILGFVEPDVFAGLYQGEGLNSHETPAASRSCRARAASRCSSPPWASGSAPRSAICSRGSSPRPATCSTPSRRKRPRTSPPLPAASFSRGSKAQGEPTDGARVLPYSPGYCGWHVSGQRKLFAFLEPEAIGVTLNQSCLMQPLKSVSGVLVVGDAATHRFHPTYAFCERCGTKQCRERMASVK